MTAFALSGIACSGPTDEGAAASASAASASQRRADARLVVGGDTSCVLGRSGLTCWGHNMSGTAPPPVLRHPSQVTLGGSHACAIDDDGVKCWGSNFNGQTTVPALRNAKQISGGASHTCALDDDGVKCWGSNSSGQTTVPALRAPIQVSAGASHTCALDADGVKCWGSNFSGQITVPALRSPTQLGAGTNHSCALDADGVKCWGSNTSMQTTVPALNHPTDLNVGGSHNCVLDDGAVKCWGLNGSMQATPPAVRRPSQLRLGRQHSCVIDDTTVKCWGSNLALQTAVPADLELVGRHACVLASGAVRCIGDNERGQLGAGNDDDHHVAMSAAQAIALGQGFESTSQIASGRASTCALGASGAIKCWGYNAFGQLGLGDARDRGIDPADMGDNLPAVRFDTDAPMTKISLGDNHACAVSSQGDVFCWGRGISGQLGTEATTDVGTTSAPTRPHIKAGLTIRDVALGSDHSCVLTTAGEVYCFGGNDAGQLGLGRAGAIGDHPGTMGDAMTPVNLGDGFTAKTLASGYRHVCALSTDGRVKCWGSNAGGELGLGDTRSRGLLPDDLGAALPAVDLGHGQVALDLACGGRHCCARMVQNTIKCWGNNAEGQLGLGDVSARGDAPGSMSDALPFVLTPPHEAVLSIALTAERTCARTDSGLRCWGRNRASELGYGDVQARGGALTTVPRLLATLGI
jgi:alpha-tubulin suppressor-like RCC1 family protein